MILFLFPVWWIFFFNVGIELLTKGFIISDFFCCQVLYKYTLLTLICFYEM